MMSPIRYPVLALTTALLTLGSCGGGDSVEAPASPDGAVKSWLEGMGQAKPQNLWASLPASYQKDVTQLVHDFAAKMDKEVWNKSMACAKNVAGLLRDKKDYAIGYIANQPMLKMMGVKTDELGKSWGSVVGMLETVVNSDLASIDKLKTLDVGAFVSSTGSKLMSQVQAAASAGPMNPMERFKGSKVELVKDGTDSAEVKVTYGDDTTETMSMKKVEGKWVPADVVADWQKNMADAREQLKEMTISPADKAQAVAMIGGIDGLVGQLKNAESQEQFSQMLDGMMQNMMK